MMDTVTRSMPYTLKSRDGSTVEVEAEVYGVWGVVPAWYQFSGFGKDEWAVTHLPSNHAVGQHGYVNREAVVKLAELLHREFHGPDWEHADRTKIPPEELAKAESVFHGWCELDGNYWLAYAEEPAP